MFVCFYLHYIDYQKTRGFVIKISHLTIYFFDYNPPIFYVAVIRLYIEIRSSYIFFKPVISESAGGDVPNINRFDFHRLVIIHSA